MPAKPALQLQTRADLVAPSAPGTALKEARRLPLDLIDPNPWQPRQHLDEGDLDLLAADMAQHGLLQPPVVRAVGDRYQIVAGERRYRAALLLGWTTLPALIQDMNDAQARAAAIRENIHRADMDPEEIGRYFLSLQEQGLSQRDIGAAIGKSAMYVNRYVKLAQDPALLAAYRAGDTTLHRLSEPPADEPERNAALQDTPPQAFRRQATLFKPVDTMRNWTQRVQVADLTQEERGALADRLDDLMGRLEALRQELELA